MTNIFKEAKQLLDKKDGGAELTEEELGLVNTAIIPLMILPQYSDIPISQGLEELARIVEEALVVVSRSRVVVNSLAS